MHLFELAVTLTNRFTHFFFFVQLELMEFPRTIVLFAS